MNQTTQPQVRIQANFSNIPHFIPLGPQSQGHNNHHHNHNHNHNYSQQIINQERQGSVTGDNSTIGSESSNSGQQQQINGNQVVKIDIISK